MAMLNPSQMLAGWKRAWQDHGWIVQIVLATVSLPISILAILVVLPMVGFDIRTERIEEHVQLPASPIDLQVADIACNKFLPAEKRLQVGGYYSYQVSGLNKEGSHVYLLWTDSTEPGLGGELLRDRVVVEINDESALLPIDRKSRDCLLKRASEPKP